MVLKVNDRRTSCPCHDEFRGPRSDYIRQRWAHLRPPERRETIGYMGSFLKVLPSFFPTVENSKRKRKRVHSKTGEILTNKNVLERLAAEESDRKNKFHQVNIKKDVKDPESFKIKQGPWVERLSTGQEVNHLNSLDKG
ncbi:hypothetical protein TNCV_5045151 [Trichonephila clavipes]|uniref:Uncharacterized protein n=1 Tax=Trichonephila clavipes TaxID=2585209 RepID=A0A8X6WI08_TRICX|nr:hypothetical protein TNCV_5045151 [Trichonephila clavipes]